MLEGIRVIDFSQNLPGPYASLRLADLGAEVIKIEPPHGDPARQQSEGNDQEDSYVFLAQNRNKKSIALNLKDTGDLQLALDLISTADVILESFRPGVMKRLGLGYEEVSAQNEGIVYCSLSGYGQSGPLHHLGSHDINFMALSGVLSQLKDQEGRPVHPNITLADLIGGMAASEAIIAALLNKKNTGKGTYLDIALADIMISLMGNHALIEGATGYQNGISILNNEIICYALYETSDNRFVSLGALEQKFWINFCKGIDREEWQKDQFSKVSEENRVYLELKEIFKSKTLKEWEQFGLKVDCCLAPVLDTSEMVEHPYVKDRKLVQNLWGTRQVATRYTKGGLGILKPTPAPKLNESKDDILTGLKTTM